MSSWMRCCLVPQTHVVLSHGNQPHLPVALVSSTAALEWQGPPPACLCCVCMEELWGM